MGKNQKVRDFNRNGEQFIPVYDWRRTSKMKRYLCTAESNIKQAKEQAYC